MRGETAGYAFANPPTRTLTPTRTIGGERCPKRELSRRTLLAGLATAPFIRPARAQAPYPTRTVQVMVPYPPAGGADTTARILYAKAGSMLGQNFVIENRGGAGGTIGEAMVAKAAPDGYQHPA